LLISCFGGSRVAHRSGKPRGAAADHDEIVFAALCHDTGIPVSFFLHALQTD
jgi:hypothetical protein